MITSAMAIGEIAYLVGYSEPAAFHRAFKRWYGATPDEFRKSVRPPRDAVRCVRSATAHSHRSARMGSIAVARRTGSALAPSAASATSAAAAAIVGQSVGSTPNS
jgi:hypothetical protein